MLHRTVIRKKIYLWYVYVHLPLNVLSVYDTTSSTSSVMPQLSSSSAVTSDLLASSAGAALSHAQQQQQQQPATTSIHLNPLLGVAPLGPQPLSKEHTYQLGKNWARNQLALSVYNFQRS